MKIVNTPLVWLIGADNGKSASLPAIAAKLLQVFVRIAAVVLVIGSLVPIGSLKPPMTLMPPTALKTLKTLMASPAGRR